MTDKPDGSAYKAHMEELGRRNAESRKDGKAKRSAREQRETVVLQARERRQNGALRSASSGGRAHLD